MSLAAVAAFNAATIKPRRSAWAVWIPALEPVAKNFAKPL